MKSNYIYIGQTCFSSYAYFEGLNFDIQRLKKDTDCRGISLANLMWPNLRPFNNENDSNICIISWVFWWSSPKKTLKPTWLVITHHCHQSLNIPVGSAPMFSSKARIQNMFYLYLFMSSVLVFSQTWSQHFLPSCQI